jgi:Asp-tRNA(Asn)/Glu-tRNA(Gln) amidotransferase A subunit family amidase
VNTLIDWLKASPRDRQAGVEASLARIRELDPSIEAWVKVDPQPATGRGALDGIPFGAKDIFETRGLPTEYGSPIYKGRVGTEDAAIVTRLRDLGAILLGKTRTTAFAYYTPGPTRNPHDVGHTPGGSSSGSAAAVAAGMVPLALGSQTKGSILRPASFCGVTGFKPTYGVVSTDGVLPLAKSFDTIGFFTHTAADMAALWEALGYETARDEDVPLGVSATALEAEAAMQTAFDETIERLRTQGAAIHTIDIADTLTELNDAADTVMAYEAAEFHKDRYDKYGSQLAHLAELICEGREESPELYEDAQTFIESARQEFSELFKTTPIVLTPAATGPAPRGLSSTGNPRMNAPWTALGVPAISIPMSVDGLPLGLQLTADRGQDARLLAAAVRIEKMLHGGSTGPGLTARAAGSR